MLDVRQTKVKPRSFPAAMKNLAPSKPTANG